ncbi:MAG: carboxypeptidase-like regulatory domain-containing protein [Bacteroidota bacterium]
MMLLMVACKKNINDTTIMEEFEPPQEKELVTIRGIVQDTSGQALPNVELKLYLNDFTWSATSDSEGKYELVMPDAPGRAHIVAASADYNRALVRIDERETGLLRERDVIMIPNPEITEVDLSFQQSNIATIQGSLRTLSGDSVGGALVAAYGINRSTTYSITFYGYSRSLSNGDFFITYDQGDYLSSVFFARPQGSCSETTGRNWNGSPVNRNLGFIIVDEGQMENASTQLTASDCTSQLSASIYLPDDLMNATLDQSLNQTIDLAYCDEIESEVVYAGIQSDDKQNFAGQFYSIDALPGSIDADPCTPNGFFLEVTLGGQSSLTSNASFSNQMLSATINNGLYSFVIGNNYSRTVDNEVVIEGGKVLQAFQLDADADRVFEKDANSDAYVHFIENTPTTIAGIITGKVVLADQSVEDIQVRFRAQK